MDRKLDITKAFPVGKKMKAKVRNDASLNSGEMSIWEMEVLEVMPITANSGMITTTIRLKVIRKEQRK